MPMEGRAFTLSGWQKRRAGFHRSGMKIEALNSQRIRRMRKVPRVALFGEGTYLVGKIDGSAVRRGDARRPNDTGGRGGTRY